MNYAIIKDGKVTKVTTIKPAKDYVICNKPIFMKGKRYAGYVPKVGYKYDGKRFDG